MAARVPASRSVSLELTYPITDPEHGEVWEITIRRPVAGDLAKLDGLGELAQARKLLSVCSGLPLGSIDEMDLADFVAASEVVEGFSQRSRPAGPS